MTPYLLLFAILNLAPPKTISNLNYSATASYCQKCITGDTSSTKDFTTFILVRHAEKEKTSNDPSLSKEGQLRAEKLLNCLEALNISAVYSTPFNRTRETVMPLAKKKGITITEYSPNLPYEQMVKEILSVNSNKIVVIAGHSNTIPEFLNVLSSKSFLVSIQENEYDNLFIVSYAENVKPVVLNLKY